ncbi:MAG: ketoacyl-ACP synthase III [Bacteroidales bacterium]|nr:ketoacyl-ACP synthase III [Bacteroidales bacterium]
MTYSIITSSGSYIPERCIKNEDFLSTEFFDATGNIIKKTNNEIIEQFLDISTIAERRYVTDDLVASDIAALAAEEALKSACFDREELDYIIVAHNFGDIKYDNRKSDSVPALAARVKHILGIKNPATVAYDILFGCPGWLQAMIQADYYIKSGDAKKVMVIGAETLSRIYDPHDRDGMLYADGAGATILEAMESDTPIGMLAHKTRSDTFLYSKMLYMDKSYNKDFEKPDDIFIKMNGRRLYQYALENVPQAMKECLEKSGFSVGDIKKVLIHQANGKMDDAILQRFYKLYDIEEIPEDIMPMTISYLGNTSVATLPTLYDLIIKGKLSKHSIEKGDIVVFASVGAGMHINAFVYKA